MNPLRPSPLLLCKLSRYLRKTPDADVLAWRAEMRLDFGGASVVKTFRAGKLCGYEVWRHFHADPKRRKARLWFGIRHWQSELGYAGAARDMAQAAAERLCAMTRAQLRAWWNKHQRDKANGRAVAALPEFEGVKLDFDDLARMSHVYERRAS